ncbi:hypothetical protein VTI74DRAFT_2950 [Chaetomium olivicolor]
MASSPSPPLCTRCCGIPWVDLVSHPPPDKTSRHVLNLSPADLDALAQSPRCHVCQLLASIIPPHLGGSHSTVRLAALSSSLSLLGRAVPAHEDKPNSDCTVLFPVAGDEGVSSKSEGRRIARAWHEGSCLAVTSVKSAGDDDDEDDGEGELRESSSRSNPARSARRPSTTACSGAGWRTARWNIARTARGRGATLGAAVRCVDCVLLTATRGRPSTRRQGVPMLRCRTSGASLHHQL